MGLNQVWQPSTRLQRARALSTVTNPTTPPTTIQPGVPVTFGDGPAVSITASGNGTKTQTTGLSAGVSSVTFANGGVGLAAGEATFAFDGGFDLAVTGATTTTADGIEVFIVPIGGALTTTSSGNVHFGWTDYPKGYTKENGRAVVKVGK